MALLSIGTPPQVSPLPIQLKTSIRDGLTNAKGPSLTFSQLVNFQAKEKKGSTEDDREVKGKDKEVRVELRVILMELHDNNDNDRLGRG